MSSDNVEVLSYSTPLTALQIYTSEKMILGQYISLSIVSRASHDLTISIQFSGDGKNWDYTINKNIAGGIGSHVNNPVEAKWSRVVITDTSGSNHTYTRVFVYGVPSNSSLSAILQGVGGSLPIVKLSHDSYEKTAFGEVLTQIYDPYKALLFNDILDGPLYDNTTTVSMFGGPYQGNDLSVLNVTQGTIADATLNQVNGVLSFQTNETSLNTEFIFASTLMPYSPGIGVEVRFTCGFNQPSTRTQNMQMLMGLMSVDGTYPNMLLHDGILVGYDDITTTSSTVQLCHYHGGSLLTRIPSTNWNSDRGDGTGDLPVIDWTKLQVCRIVFGYLGTATTLFQVMSPTGVFVTCHSFNFPGTLNHSTFELPGFRVGAFMKGSSPASSSKDASIISGSMSLGHNGPHRALKTMQSHDVQVSGITSQKPIFSLKNFPTWHGRTNVRIINIDSISISNKTTGGGVAILRMYRNATLTGSVFVATGSHFNPGAKDEVATALSASSTHTYSIALTSDSALVIPMSSNPHSADNSHFSISPGNTISFTLESTNSTDCELTVNWYMR